MANTNFFQVVNLTGATLSTNVNGEQVDSIPSNGHSDWIIFPDQARSGESFNVMIEGSEPKVQQIQVNAGTNSWTVLVYTSNGYVNIFPSSVNNRVALPG